MSTFAIIGLGRIGGGLALQALSKGHRVVGLDVAGASEDLLRAGLLEARTLDDLATLLEPSDPSGSANEPRIIFLYIHAGPAVDEELGKLSKVLRQGDIVLDGGNSYWGDSKVRASRMAELGIRFLDLGTSGGLSGARNGACFMCGGERAAFEIVEPILRDLAVPGGVVYAGPSGSGHFVKLVHNGIEFGMLQAIGEGIDLLERYPEELPIADVVGCWRNGSVIRSWLVDLMHEALTSGPPPLSSREAVDEGGVGGGRSGGGFTASPDPTSRPYQGQAASGTHRLVADATPGYIEDTGEVNWLVEDALRMEVPIPVISASVMQLFASRDDRKAWARAIALMRRGFGGHPIGPDAAVAQERRTSKVGLQEPT